MIKVLVFDFDGVIIDSNRIKNAAWDGLFVRGEVTPAYLASVLDKVKRSRGTRFDVLQTVFSDHGHPPETVVKLTEEYAKRYNDIVVENINKLGITPDAISALLDLSRRYPLYINSATPAPALLETMSLLNISHLFRASFGVPPTKEENMQAISAREGVGPEEIAFIGDAETDWLAAQRTGVYFVGFANADNNWTEREFPLVSNLAQVGELVKSVV